VYGVRARIQSERRQKSPESLDKLAELSGYRRMDLQSQSYGVAAKQLPKTDYGDSRHEDRRHCCRSLVRVPFSTVAGER
jgi:hypothetical protein